MQTNMARGVYQMNRSGLDNAMRYQCAEGGVFCADDVTDRLHATEQMVSCHDQFR